ncbi:MAG TPA: HEAT repeat domain-containing protein [Pirellulales bacterium]|nr:HEAT repeat domain-containing protein [Pirellulales bacterium]
MPGDTDAAAFDPYHRWLGIPPAEQPANHYRLLGLALFESDPNVIESGADRQMGHVRSYAGGQQSAASQRVLNELAAAKLCLLSPVKKAAYDLSLAPPAPAAQATPLPAPVAIPVPVAPTYPRVMPAATMPIPTAAPLRSEPAKQEPSLATERWLAKERSTEAFYRLLTRTIVAIVGAVPACVMGYAVWQRHQDSTAMVRPRAEPTGFTSVAPIEQPSVPPVPKIEYAPKSVDVKMRPTVRRPLSTESTVPATTDDDTPQASRDFFDLPKVNGAENSQDPQESSLKSAVENAAEGLRSTNPVVRRSAIDKLARMSDAAAASTVLADYVRHESEGGLKTAAVQAIGSLGTTSDEAVDVLAEIVSGDTPAHVQVKSKKYTTELRREALHALEKIGPPARQAVPVVLRIMESAAKNVRQFHGVFCECAKCLGEIGEGRKDLVQALTRFASGRGFDDPASRYCAGCKAAAAKALAKIRSREA